MRLVEFLRKPRENKQCVVCKTPAIRKAVDTFLREREKGRTSVSVNYFHFHYLVPTFSRPRSLNSLLNHMRSCLGKG